jgi:hypothetical protein
MPGGHGEGPNAAFVFAVTAATANATATATHAFMSHNDYANTACLPKVLQHMVLGTSEHMLRKATNVNGIITLDSTMMTLHNQYTYIYCHDKGDDDKTRELYCTNNTIMKITVLTH